VYQSPQDAGLGKNGEDRYTILIQGFPSRVPKEIVEQIHNNFKVPPKIPNIHPKYDRKFVAQLEILE
jgi:hypothetical protein